MECAAIAHIGCRRWGMKALWLIVLLLSCSMFHEARAEANNDLGTSNLPHTVTVGVTGFADKRPVLAAACRHGCPWGELGAFVRQAMAPFGYDVILCENCNRQEGPRIVGARSYPPPLSQAEMSLGTDSRVDARVDFGITSSVLLTAAARGEGPYAGKPIKNLRLITKIEDPYYVLVAVKASAGITDLRQIKERKLPVRILADGPASTLILDYYGLTKDQVLSWGGSIGTTIGIPDDTPFDLLVSQLAGPGGNPESAFWTVASQKNDLRFLDLPKPLLDRLTKLSGMERVTAEWGLLRGIDRPIDTVGWSGEAVFGRADMPDSVAYDIAKALDQHRAALKWFVRPYSYDPETAWQTIGVLLHPGAARYFREKGYMPAGAAAASPN
jgi:TRAP transporter TAXI family solute receptor